MKNIKNFELYEDFEKFRKYNSIKLIDSGSEGKCYLGKERYVYKFFDTLPEDIYNIDEIITEDDIKLNSFALPKELFVYNNKLLGCKMEYVDKDYFNIENTYDLSTIDSISFKQLSKAYKYMLCDVARLSDKNILIDLPCNLMYDGESLIGVDTCIYKKVDFDPLDDNIHSLNSAIETVFEMWFDTRKRINISIDYTNIDKYLDTLYKELPSDIKKKCKKRLFMN